jgi:hypothetical protein
MVDRGAALAHHLLEIPIADPVAAIPQDRPEHDLTLEVNAPLKVRYDPSPCPGSRPRRLQQSLAKDIIGYRQTESLAMEAIGTIDPAA